MTNLKTIKKELFKHIDEAGGRLAYDVSMNKGDLLFFIHGIGCNKASFKHVWDAVELKAYSKLAVDLMGYGASDGPEGFSYDMKDQARACFDLILSLGFEKIHVVAHSMGGAVGILLAQMIEDSDKSLESFVSVEGNFIASDCGLISRKIIGMDYEYFEKTHFNYLKENSSLSYDMGVKEWSRQFNDANPLGFYRSAYSLVKWSDSGDLLKIFNSLHSKKAYIYGAATEGLEVLGVLDEKICHRIENSGHFIMIEAPEAFHVTLRDIVRRD
ncbi:alpha/beta fold hydrolase [Fusibacter sp. JL216-2]|uniref:alpha/beta fold hydrolase n=1 Tax=Fusibacter sp. JL216-2 TaxID=3071453 RepID=UPI003D33D4A9